MEIMNKKIKSDLKESIEIKRKVIKNLVPEIEKAANLMINCLKSGKKILLFGNGGSAADTQHIAAELVNTYQKKRKPLPAIALTTDSSVLTSIANDADFENIFERQIEALAKKGDVAIAISTSGNSKNVFQGLKKAKELKCATIALLGNKGGIMKNRVDVAIIVPSDKTPRIQESHITIAHILCGLTEEALFP